MRTSRSVDKECIFLTEYLMIERFIVVRIQNVWFMVPTQDQILRYGLSKGK